ncbi:MAG TPA: hypothetical protein VE776_13745 [Actinomycetota bacterium]|nr:hypothetical protein [Actinomycetota bacterium]
MATVQGRWRSPTRVAVVVSVLLYSWWATTFRPFTWPIRIGTAVPAVFLVLLAARDHRRRSALRTWVASWHLVEEGEPAPLWRRVVWRAGTMYWTALIAAISIWELAARLHTPRSLYPTLSSLSGSVTRMHAVRFLTFVLWLLFGRDLLRR